MTTVRTISELRASIKRAHGNGAVRVGLVPTMGALHDGHLSLVAAAKKTCDLVVLSIFVNPTQFGDAADLDAYPRDEQRDVELAERAGVDLVFTPEAAEMYPAGFATTVSVDGEITSTLEGAVRGREHFDGVATVVAKLLIAAQPDAAYFGQKDAQQLVVVRRMVADLGLPVDIVACPTARESDGLARSSRNARLSSSDRRRAAAIPRALAAVEAAVADGETSTALLRAMAERCLEEQQITADYVSFVDPDTLEPVTAVDRSVLCAVAAPVGGVRLLDNMLLEQPDVPPEPARKAEDQ